MRLLLFAIFAILFSSYLSAADISSLDKFLSNPDIWKIESERFLADGSAAQFARWLSDKEKNAARYPRYNGSPQMTFLDKKVVEAIFRFSDAKLSKIEVSIYNRGDIGDISPDAFDAMVENLFQAIEKWSGDKGFEHEKQRLRAGIKIEKKAWVKNNLLSIVMLWSMTERKKEEDRPEYIKVEISSFDPKNDPRKKNMTTLKKSTDIMATVSHLDLKKNVKKDEAGNIFIDGIPMVDQGQKGYCAVAVAETVLRYYGAEVDQHLIAQLADSSNSGGTNPEFMYEMLKKTSVKFGIKVREYISFDYGKFEKMINKYNSIAKKMKKAPVTSGMLAVDDYYQQMDFEVLKIYKLKNEKSDYNKFKKEIFSSIDLGMPLLWGVELGMVEEKPKLPQSRGGHMRLIRGYNNEKNELIYSDTWGAGHERKTMNMDDAWTVTTGLYGMEPRT